MREYDEFNKANNEIIRGRLETLIRKFQNDASLLKHKHNKDFDFLVKQRDEDLDRLVKKYKNRKADIQSKQNCERYVTENVCAQKYTSKYFVNLATNSFKNVKQKFRTLSFSDMESRIKEIANMIKKKYC
jgi:hypothetical protein